jgi:6-phosphogluconolactonase
MTLRIRLINSRNILFLFLLQAALIFSSCDRELILVAGGFTTNDENGLKIFSFNTRNGSLQLRSEHNVGPSPAYFCFDKSNNMFYMANEVMEFKGEFGGGLTALKYDPLSGAFERKKELLIPWAGPCFISMSDDSTHLFLANYPNGSVVVVSLDEEGIPETVTDTILYVKNEPDASHAHMIMHDPAGDYVYVSDLGLDRIVRYEFDSVNGVLNETMNGITNIPGGSGPRHFAFNKDGSKLYLINELGSTIMVFGLNQDSSPELLQTVPTKKDESIVNNYCADIHIGKNGKFLYGSNRGENSIVVYRIGEDGLLELSGHSSCGGDWPRNFTIDPTGKYLLVGNQKSNEIAVFRLNRKTGLPEGPLTKVEMKMPACLKFY